MAVNKRCVCVSFKKVLVTDNMDIISCFVFPTNRCGVVLLLCRVPTVELLRVRLIGNLAKMNK